MAEQATTEQKYMYGNPQLPVLYDDGRLLVYTNGSGEIFVQNKAGNKRTEMRIGPYGNELVVTASDAHWIPGLRGGLTGFRIQAKM